MAGAVSQQDAEEARAGRDQIETAVAIHVGATNAEDPGGVRERLRCEMARSIAEEQHQLPRGSRGLHHAEVELSVAVQIAERRNARVGRALTGRDVDRRSESTVAVTQQHENVVSDGHARAERCRDVRLAVAVEIANRKPAGTRVQRNRRAGGEATSAIAKQYPELAARRLALANRRDGEVWFAVAIEVPGSHVGDDLRRKRDRGRRAESTRSVPEQDVGVGQSFDRQIEPAVAIEVGQHGVDRLACPPGRVSPGRSRLTLSRGTPRRRSRCPWM